MGWSSYHGMGGQEAVDHELRGTELIRKAGSWRLVRVPTSGKHVLVHALVRREDGQAWVKLVDSSMGPVDTPPKGIFDEWLRLSKGQERGRFEMEFIERVRNEHIDAAAVKRLRAGDVFRFATPVKFTDGVEEDTFVYLGKFRAKRRCDEALIRLPKNFRRRIVVDTLV